MGIVVGIAAAGLLKFPAAIAQTNANREFFQGRGIAQGSAFTNGRNANLSLTLSGENFSLEMIQPQSNVGRNQTPARVQYRGMIVRRNLESGRPNDFILIVRVRSFDSSDTFRVISNTTGTCRLEIFDARVTYSNCNAIATDSSTRFLGLEQF